MQYLETLLGLRLHSIVFLLLELEMKSMARVESLAISEALPGGYCYRIGQNVHR